MRYGIMGNFKSRLKRGGGNRMTIVIEDAGADDLAEIQTLNNAATPNVNRLEITDLAELLETAAYFRIARVNRQLSGFLIGLTPEADYQSPNFLWFKAQYQRFVYIDRVVVGQGFRRHGVASVLYADIQSFAEQTAPLLSCEVLLKPKNTVSLLFHGTSGFKEVGQLAIPEQNKVVSLLIKELPTFAYIEELQAGAAI